MGAALVLLLVGLGAMAAGVLIGRYYVPDDRQLRRTARHSRAYMRALGHLIARDHDTVVEELRGVVEENIDDVEPYFALGAMFRSKGEHERAIRVHQALAVRERDRKKLRLRAMYELGLDFRAAGMPRRATRAMEEVLLDDPGHEGGLRSLAALYEEQARFSEAAGLWERLGKRRSEDLSQREHHLYVAAAQAAMARGELDAGKQLLKEAQRRQESAHFFAGAAELAAARGNHRGAKERLRQALTADPALAPHLLPGLIAAELGIDGGGKAGKRERERDKVRDDLAESSPALPVVTDAMAADAIAQPEHPGQAALPAGASETALAVAKPDVAIVPGTHALVPDELPTGTVNERVGALLADIERETGPRIELALIRAQLAHDGAATELASDLTARFPGALAAQVATARIALASRDPAAVRAALDTLAGDGGSLAWALRGRWQCAHCNHRPSSFSWRCGSCRRWGTLRMETGVEPPPLPARDRRAAPRAPDHAALLGARPDESLPMATLDSGLSDEELLAKGAPKPSLLNRVGGWASRVWRRDR